jgi:hypothetical protein
MGANGAKGKVATVVSARGVGKRNASRVSRAVVHTLHRKKSAQKKDGLSPSSRVLVFTRGNQPTFLFFAVFGALLGILLFVWHVA